MRWPAWMRTALVQGIVGFSLGCTTAVLLITSSVFLFPQLQELGHDYGLAAAAYFGWVANAAGNAPVRVGASDLSFVFLDVDPEFALSESGIDPTLPSEESSVQPCMALVGAQPDRLGPPGARDDRAATRARVARLCASARPLNRYLLAALVSQLSEWGARVIVLDVLIADEPGVIGDDENGALTSALLGRGDEAAKVPIVWALPVRVGRGRGESAGHVQLDEHAILKADPALGMYAAVALSLPGEPVRRYAKCWWNPAEANALPSLPYQAAQLAVNPSRPAHAACSDSATASHDDAPRIVYTLPAAESHEDDRIPSEARVKWAHYRPVYNRCLAAAIWSRAGSACADAATYRGKVVVIGASSPARRDRHDTPLGEMAGAENVINAIRSFAAFPHNHDKSLGALLRKKLGIVLWCSIVWMGYFMLVCQRREAHAHNTSHAFWRYIGSGMLFVVTLATVSALAFWLSLDSTGPLPSLDVFIPVLAIALELYVETVSAGLHRLEHWLQGILGISDHEGST